MGQLVTKPHINLTHVRVHAHILLREKASKAKRKTSMRERIFFFFLHYVKHPQCSNFWIHHYPVLAYIYNASLAQGSVSDDWRQANMAPIYKKGGKYDPANYRPVSLTCICCKTVEHIIVSNINRHLASESILAVSMDSEVKGLVRHSLSSLYTISNLDGAANRGHKQTDITVMDFDKAFDKVTYRRLQYTN